MSRCQPATFGSLRRGSAPLAIGSLGDFYSGRLLGFAMNEEYPDAELAKTAINMAVAVRDGAGEERVVSSSPDPLGDLMTGGLGAQRR